MLRQRILTALVLLPLFFAALLLASQRVWGAVLLAPTLLAALEWGRLASLRGSGQALLAFSIAAGSIALALFGSSSIALVLFAVGLVFWIAVVPLWLGRRLEAGPLALAGAGWLVLVCAWYALYTLHANPVRLLALIAVVWIADSFAYFSGRRFGRRKLAPSISPGKTWEGVAGAAVAVGVYYALLWHLLSPAALGDHKLIDFVLVVGVAALSVEGDLFESWMKRRVGVKDSGTILPGHGGVLDRIDGLVAALPLAAGAAAALTTFS